MDNITDFFKRLEDKIRVRVRKTSSLKIIVMVFGLLILLGTILLMLPISAKSGEGTGFTDALFTATSATCVTGLIRFDTFTYWTTFGQIVILCMIQVGGMGFMTIAIMLMWATGHKIGLNSRFLMQNSISAPQVGGMVRISKMILIGTAFIEGLGAIFLSGIFIPKYGVGKGIYFSVFHSISAFCNAGFDLMGGEEQFSSLTGFGGNWYLNLIIMLLIIIGGLGFFVWQDILYNKIHFRKMRLHTKLVLTTSAVLIVLGAVMIFWLEYGEAGTDGKSIPAQILNATFQSVTTRTAGFNTIDLTKMTDASIFVMIGMMLIGGSPGSTAGGMKTTTFAVLSISIISIFRRKKSEEAFGRRMDEDILRSAACVFMIYIFLTSAAALLIAKLESVPMMTALFESASALGTVGLTLGITPQVGMVSKLVLAALMFIGRVGSITILMAFSSERKMVASKLPLEKVQIG
ncbi:MAG: Trk family potassium uptake protein [Clostridia bacterium]|nr:Trk family potassium uptake protein [Clostridia bacterium]NCC42365.1 Trk family potassium uptake protein [Clostridia bacterium]